MPTNFKNHKRIPCKAGLRFEKKHLNSSQFMLKNRICSGCSLNMKKCVCGVNQIEIEHTKGFCKRCDFMSDKCICQGNEEEENWKKGYCKLCKNECSSCSCFGLEILEEKNKNSNHHRTSYEDKNSSDVNKFCDYFHSLCQECKNYIHSCTCFIKPKCPKTMLPRCTRCKVSGEAICSCRKNYLRFKHNKDREFQPSITSKKTNCFLLKTFKDQDINSESKMWFNFPEDDCIRCGNYWKNCECSQENRQYFWRNGECFKCNNYYKECICEGVRFERFWTKGKCSKCQNFCQNCICKYDKREEFWKDGNCLRCSYKCNQCICGASKKRIECGRGNPHCLNCNKKLLNCVCDVEYKKKWKKGFCESCNKECESCSCPETIERQKWRVYICPECKNSKCEGSCLRTTWTNVHRVPRWRKQEKTVNNNKNYRPKISRCS